MPTVTAAEAAQMLAAEQRAMNASRTLPPTLARIRLLMKEESFPICNVGPWSYRPERASLTVFIPAYDKQADPQHKGYAESAPMPVIFRQAKIVDENEFGWIEDDGRAVAQDLCGVGFGMHPNNSLFQYGVFIPAGSEPTAEEVAEARRKLDLCYDRLIEDARDAYDKGPAERKAVISDRHLLAARVRGLNEPWVHHQHSERSVQCEMCGKFNPAGVAKCACGTILDFDLYQRIQARQDRLLEEATRPKPVQPPVKK